MVTVSISDLVVASISDVFEKCAETYYQGPNKICIVQNLLFYRACSLTTKFGW